MTKETKTLLILAGVFLVAAIVAFYFVNEAKTELEAKQAAIDALNQDIAGLQKQVDQRDTLEKELASLKANLSQYMKILPAPEIATVEGLMALVQEKSERSQVTIKTYESKEAGGKAKGGRRGKKKGGSAFKEIGLTLAMNGTYDQFLRFLNSLERHETFVRVNRFSVSSLRAELFESKIIWPLRIDLNVSTFRFDPGGK